MVDCVAFVKLLSMVVSGPKAGSVLNPSGMGSPRKYALTVQRFT